ncbi:hypothetical protein D3C86_1039280 [compost metagenome]
MVALDLRVAFRCALWCELILVADCQMLSIRLVCSGNGVVDLTTKLLELFLHYLGRAVAASSADLSKLELQFLDLPD